MREPGILRSFEDRTMGFKLTVVFLLVILVPMTLLAYVSYKVIDSNLLAKAHEKIDIGLKAAWTEYYVRGEQMRYGMLQAATSEDFKGAVARRDRAYLDKTMSRWKESRPYVDVWTVVGADGRVIERLNGDYNGDVVELNGLVGKAFKEGIPQVSTEIFTKEMLRFEGAEVSEKAAAIKASPGQNGKEAVSDGIEAEGAMALTVVTPVLDEKRAAIGAIITADVLNNDSHIPDAVANKFPGLFTTISFKGVRIATNVINSEGGSVKNTPIPANTAASLASGASSSGEWEIQGVSYISTFDPIKDNTGAVIGSLDAGISKESLWIIQKANQQIIAAATLIGIVFSLMAAFVSSYRITRPLNNLKDKLSAFAAGDMSARVEADLDRATRDEIKNLARTFNSMMDEVEKREAEKAQYLGEIEERNREFSALNEELKIKNEEIEVAYEETQSQTEELHAINEELKLLNEDLDRKNAELQRANKTIKTEEEELKKAKDKLRLIYDSIKDYVLLVDYNQTIREANRSFIDSFKLDESSVIGKKVCGYFSLECAVKNCPVRRAIDTMAPAELELTLPNGKVFTWEAFPLIEDDDAVKKAVVYIRDITEERLLMQKLMHSDKLSSLGELVSGVAHELNNPLTGIMCFSELLMEEKLGDSVNSKLAKITDASNRCKRIIDNLLTFARWHKPEKKYEDINGVIRGAVDMRAYQLKVDNIELKLELDPSAPRTMLDGHQIQQVVLNLINNARDAIKETGRSGRITIRSFNKPGRLFVKVEDTGKGISKEVAERIFDPFFTTKGVGKGTGLGLSISYGIVKEHGGDIYAEGRPEGGAVFTMELPVTEEAFGDISPDEDASVERRRLMEAAKGLNALILDDEPIVLDILDESLSASGFNVERTDNALEAIERLKESDYSIIISDIKMPGLDGREFYREVKNIRPGALKRIIFISGDSVSPETQQFLKETGNQSLKKPFTMNQLNSAILKLIS